MPAKKSTRMLQPLPPNNANFPPRKISGLARAEIVSAVALQGFWRICETTAWTVHRASRIAPRIHLGGHGGPVHETAQTRAGAPKYRVISISDVAFVGL